MTEGAAPPELRVDAPPATGLRARLALAMRARNPIWEREMQQSVRRGAVPVVQMLLTIALTLLLSAIGGTMSVFSPSASVGRTLFQTFFSAAYFVVTLAGPALAATSIASEREGRTWEAVVLTGMRPAEIAHGKFLAALTTVGSYLVVLAPVGALPFLFGGVTATETFVAFGWLFALASLGVAFGLAVSSRMMRTGASIVVTLLLSFVVATTSFSTFGVGMSFAAQSLWPSLPTGSPVWLPLAYDRAELGVPYVIFLVVLPLLVLGVPAWFLYEATVANLSATSDDRSSGLKRWLAATVPLVTLVSCVLPLGLSAGLRPYVEMGAISVLALLLGFCVVVFAGEPLGPSRRVESRFDERRASARTRWLGPGLVPTMTLLGALGLAGFALTGAAAAVYALGLSASGASSAPRALVAEVVVLAAYGAAFFVFLVGLATFARARSSAGGPARAIVVVATIVATAGPWIVALIGGVLAESGPGDVLVVAAPSPFYVVRVISALEGKSVSGPGPIVLAGAIAMTTWTLVGVVLFFLGGHRARRVVAEHRAALARVDATLDAEDGAAST